MFTLNCNGKLLLIDKPLVMGIINATPDSFYQGSRFFGTDKILEHAEKLIVEKADIIDIGGQSTRPGSKPVSQDEELRRVIDGIECIRKKFSDIIISVDTFYSVVAKAAVQAGASMVNDISAGTMDEQMIATVAELKVPYVAMHIKGTPETMQQQAHYGNVTREVIDFFIGKKGECTKAGIRDLIIDPGFGFAKNAQHNFELLRNLATLKIIDCPILVGLSRKSTIYKTLGISADEALNGTTVLNTIALMNGATILRVHDVREAKETVALCTLINPLVASDDTTGDGSV
jgi:dihydropteroate synthase